MNHVFFSSFFLLEKSITNKRRHFVAIRYLETERVKQRHTERERGGRERKIDKMRIKGTLKMTNDSLRLLKEFAD